MTTLSISKIPHLNIVAVIWALYKKVSNNFSNARKLRNTISELNKLSPRILEDIGISKFNINAVAYKHVYGKIRK